MDSVDFMGAGPMGWLGLGLYFIYLKRLLLLNIRIMPLDLN